MGNIGCSVLDSHVICDSHVDDNVGLGSQMTSGHNWMSEYALIRL